MIKLRIRLRFDLTIVGYILGPSQLTTSSLEKHDAQFSETKMDQGFDAATFKTWATDITECTNTTFNKVHQNWKNDAAHKEVCFSICFLGWITDSFLLVFIV